MLALIKPKFQPTFNSIAKNDCRIIKLQFKEKFIKRCGSFDCSFSCNRAVFKWSDDGTAVASHRPEHQRLFPMHFQSWWGKGRGSCNFGTAATAVCNSCSSLGQPQLQFEMHFWAAGESSCNCILGTAGCSLICSSRVVWRKAGAAAAAVPRDCCCSCTWHAAAIRSSSSVLKQMLQFSLHLHCNICLKIHHQKRFFDLHASKESDTVGSLREAVKNVLADFFRYGNVT